LRLRQVERRCGAMELCTLRCDPGEVPLNAVCPRETPAFLLSRSEFSCGRLNDGVMIAFCARP
jgi:hypothetical protein